MDVLPLRAAELRAAGPRGRLTDDFILLDFLAEDADLRPVFAPDFFADGFIPLDLAAEDLSLLVFVCGILCLSYI